MYRFRLLIFFQILFTAALTHSLAAQQLRFQKFNIRLPSSFIKEIKVSENYLWVATSAGLVRAEPDGSSPEVYTATDGLPDTFVTSIQIDPQEKTAWIGTPSGLGRMDIDSGRVTVYNRRQRNLSDDRVNSLLLDKNTLYVGTMFGVDKFDIKANRWTPYTAIEGLAGNNIQTLVAEGDYIWAGGADGIAYYDKNEDFWISYGVTNGLNNNLVTSLVVDADALWVGTFGGGISRFDKAAERFEPFTTEYGLVDDQVQTLIDDGSFLWIGTFGGISRFDKDTLRFTNFGAQDGLKEPSIYAGTVRGDRILAGSDGAGIFIADKKRPQVSFSYQQTRYLEEGRVGIYGTLLSDSDIKNLRVIYKPAQSVQDTWFTEGIELASGQPENTREDLLATLETSKLTDGRFNVALEVTDNDGMQNKAYGTVIVDNIKPEIDLFFRPPEKGAKDVMVSGRYIDLNLDTLEVTIGSRKVNAAIDRQQKRFRFPYPIDSNQKIKITARDIGLNTATIEKSYVVDNDPPEVTVEPVDGTKLKTNVVTVKGTVKEENIEQVIVNPGQIPAELTPIGDAEYEYEAKAPIKKEGKYTFQITAFDQAGRTTTESLTVQFYSDVTIVEIADDKLPSFTLKDNIELQGNILGPMLKEFYIMPGKDEIPVADNKSFSKKLFLKPGMNKFTIVAVHANGEVAREKITVESSKKTVAAPLDIDSRSFTESNVTLQGKYDQGITKIVVNRKDADMNESNRTYEVDINIKEGKNPVKITTVDELGRVKSKTENVYLDRDAPGLYVRSLPSQTGLNTIRFKGRIREVSGYKLTVFPAAAFEYHNIEKGEFEGRLNLKKGVNRIYFVAEDAAGNIKRRDFLIEHDESYAKREVGAGAENEEELMALRREIEMLRKKLAGKSVTATSFARKKLPANAGLYLVPTAGKIPSYSTTAHIYLGDDSLADLVAGFNGRRARDLRRMLVPTPQLFTLLALSRERYTFEQVMRNSGVAYMRSKSRAAVEKQVLRYLVRSRRLKKVKQHGSYTVFETRKGSGVVITSGSAPRIPGYRELLVTEVTASGISFKKF